MAPVDLEGETLGERHRHYNKLVLEAAKQTTRPDRINPDNADIENLIKIDVASYNRDLEYIIEVLRCDDMLYVSRVLRNGAWLMEVQYAHVFNAEYLHAELLPTMTARAGRKLLLYVRTHMKDEQRADQFYLYFKDKNLEHAFKWLPYCSLSVANQAVQKYQDKIDSHIIKRLCEKSINFLKEFVTNNTNYCVRDVLKSTMFLLKTNMETYLDIIDSMNEETWYYVPKFGPKATKLIMKTCPHRILDKFEKYIKLVDLKTVADHVKPEDIKGFLVKHMENKEIKNILHYGNLRYFFQRMPKEGRFEFIKAVFIDKEEPKNVSAPDKMRSEPLSEMCFGQSMTYHCVSLPRVSMKSAKFKKVSQTRAANIYKWYHFASFETAFPDLKKLIRAESSPAERQAILSVLLTCAGRNPQHIHDLLKFYQECHINEPFKFKIHFVNQVISKTKTHRYDSKTWDILNNIFHSLGVYTDSDTDVSSCVQSIIVHKTVHDEKIPDVVEKKFTFTTLKSLQKKLSAEESKKVSGFLYRYLENKLQGQNLSDKNEFTKAVDVVEDLRTLIEDWKEHLDDCPLLQAKADDLIKVMTEQGWTKEFSWLYDRSKWWRRQLFMQSLTMCPSEDTLLNVLKHQPTLLEQHEEAVQELCRDDNTTLWRLLFKLRVYWPHSRARDWTAAYRARLTTSGGHRALVRGLCALLPPSDMLALLRQYVPQNTKIEWATENEIILSVRKNLAQNMHRARPPPPIEMALLYARGDYLQFAISAFRELVHNLNAPEAREVLPSLLDAPVSLRKHGLRLAYARLPAQELKPIFTRIWTSTKNSTLRAVIFKQTFDLLCQEKRSEFINEIWEMLSSFIADLTAEDNREIYSTFSKINKVPLEVRGQFCMRSYKFLKTLPAKANCEDIFNNVTSSTKEIIDKLDYDFVINDLMPNVIAKLEYDTWYLYIEIIPAFLLTSPDEESQDLRYRTILLPLLQKALNRWDEKKENDEFPSRIIDSLLTYLCGEVTRCVLEKDIVIPVKLFAEIQKEIEKNLSIERDYHISTRWKLAATWVKIMDEQKAMLAKAKEAIAKEAENQQKSREGRYGCRGSIGDDTRKWDKALTQLCPEFSQRCLSHLREDLKNLFPSVYLLFADALKSMTSIMNFSLPVVLEILKHIICDEFVPSYLVVIKNMDPYVSHESADNDKGKEIKRLLSLHPSLEIKMHYHKRLSNARY